MKLEQLFLKDITRNIEGVIKADDTDSLLSEVEEYVLTNEVAGLVETFFDEYTDYVGANGAWISGFFGSGKSHLLKMLTLLLENREIQGKRTLDVFLPKCEGNSLLSGGIKKAAAYPTETILFNIDQKADLIAPDQEDALLRVFVKVFDEHCGYFGKQGFIGKFERDLDKASKFAEFKQVFQKVSGKPWEVGRDSYILQESNISKAYAQISDQPGETVTNILQKYKQDYRVSIEDFALTVKEYIDTKEKDFRFVFLVDEMGQYIADRIRLMTNLQTLAESLATKCKGQAWIVVTAQEELDSILGEMNSREENDFSKIQARFKTKIKLTSKNVTEVIQKRLLEKNDQGKTLIADVYTQQVNNFGTLFDFTDGSYVFRNFRDQNQFVISYPFPFYQYELFQKAIINLSAHSAFTGRHSSIGERSMLAVFQQVAQTIKNKEVGELASFDLMFEGLKLVIKGTIQQSILDADNNLENKFAVQVLKALFLVKYVKEFKPTLHNISVLMIDHFNLDMAAHRQKVEQALNLLESQSYIERNGELYEFLTNEEKDIETEIKNLDVENETIIEYLSEVVFDKILRDPRIRYDENDQDFRFGKKIDDHPIGREYELCIHVISPFNEQIGNDEILRMHSMGRDELLILCPADDRLIKDLYMHKRTDKYIRQNTVQGLPESKRSILEAKSAQNRTRAQNIEDRMKVLLGNARLFVSGNEIFINAQEAETRIKQAFWKLIPITYPNLAMLRNIRYTENDIEHYLNPVGGLLPGMEGNQQTEPEQELLSSIKMNYSTGIKTTFKILSDRFEKKPYGWSLAAIQCNFALLHAHSKVEIRLDGTVQEGANLTRALRNTQVFANLVIEPVVDFSAAQIRQLKDFYGDFFDHPTEANEAREVGKETAGALGNKLQELKQLFANKTLYPFLEKLAEPINALTNVVGKPYSYYLNDFQVQQNQLLDFKESLLSPITTFWNGVLRGIYDDARSFINEQSANFDYVERTKVQEFKELLADPEVFRSAKAQQLKATKEALKREIDVKLAEERNSSIATIAKKEDLLKAMSEFATLTSEQQNELLAEINRLKEKINTQALIAKIRDDMHYFEETQYLALLTRMQGYLKPVGKQPFNDKKAEYVVTEYISGNAIIAGVQMERAVLTSEDEINQYTEKIRSAMIAEVKKGKRIQI